MPEITFDRHLSARLDAVGQETEQTLRDVADVSRSLKTLADAEARQTLRETTATLRETRAALGAFRSTAARTDALLADLSRTCGKLEETCATVDAAVDDARAELVNARRRARQFGCVMAVVAFLALCTWAARTYADRELAVLPPSTRPRGAVAPTSTKKSTLQSLSR